MSRQAQPRVLGRYLFYAPIASGGMATVYLGRMAGPKGFSRIVAIKQLHAQLLADSDFVTMFLDEAHLIGRIHHSNVVAPIDVLEADGDLCIVMEYVHGEALGRLMRLSRQDHMPLRVVTSIMIQTLLGLHAAHEVTDVDGKPLAIVHRDVSPQNILVGEDGIARVVDFGIAKAAHRATSADVGKLKGKLGYMAPEQLQLCELDRRCDIFAAGIILWEMLTGKKLFTSDGPVDAAERMLRFEPKPPSAVVPALSPELDAIAMRALCVKPDERFPTAHEMARALELACPPAGAIEVAAWMTQLVGDTLRTRAEWIADLSSMDLGEWTQTYVMSSSLPLVVSSAPPPARSSADSLPVSEVEHSVPVSAAIGSAQTRSQETTTRRQLAEQVDAKKARERRRAMLVLPLAALGIVLVGFVWWRRANAPSGRERFAVLAASPTLATANMTMASSSAALFSALAPSAASPAESSLGTPMSVPQNSASVGVSAKVESQALTSSGGQAQVKVATKRTTAPSNCKVPYYRDEQGIKRFRPECFRRH